MWKSIQTFISLFYLDLYSLLLSLKYTVATEKVKLTVVNVRTVFFKKWNDLFWALVSIYWLGSKSENIITRSPKTYKNSTTLNTSESENIITRSPKTYENSTTLNTSESANINKKSKNLWKLHNIEYIWKCKY